MTSAASKADSPATLTHFIGGRFFIPDGGEFGDVFDPATGKVAARVPMADLDLTREAIAAARQALPSWAGTPPLRRARVMFRFRELLEQIPFPIGYGVETSMNMDIYEKWGLDVMAQVDLDRRIHRNQDTKALGRMSFVILKTFINRKIRLGLIDLKEALFDEMIQYNLVNEKYQADILKIEGHERPPIIEIPEYREKFKTDQIQTQELQEA